MEPRLSEAFEASSPKVEETARELSAYLTSQDIPHAIVGALAVGAYGHARARLDVDAILPSRLFKGHGKLVLLPPGLPSSSGVRIDYVLVKEQFDPLIDEALAAAPLSPEGIRVIGVEALVMMKLIAGRAKDQADVVELLKLHGPPLALDVTAYLRPRVPDLLPTFSTWAEQARREMREVSG